MPDLPSLLIVTELFFPHVGGQEIRYLQLARHLARLGHRVGVLTMRHSRSVGASERIEDVRVVRVPLIERYVMNGSRDPAGVVRYVWGTAGVLRTIEPVDVTIVNQWPLVHLPVIKKVLSSPFVVDWCELYTGWRGMVQRLLTRLPDGHLAVGGPVYSRLTEQFGVDSGTVELVPNGVDLGMYGSVSGERDPLCLLYIGRLTPHKRVDLLIEAAKRLSRVGLRLRVEIVGSGPQMSWLKEIAAPLGSSVRFRGLVSEETKIRLLKGSSALVLPSEREGYGSVVVEAMAAGKPVVTGDFRGNAARHLVRSNGCGLVVPHSMDGFSRGIETLLSDGSLWDRCSSAGLARARSLDWADIAERLSQFLCRILG